MSPRYCLSAVLFSGMAATASAAVNFEKEIWPIFEKKCVECHRAPFEENGKKKEPKAGLRLDASWAIMKGSENGPVLKAKDPSASGIYESVTLPEDDDDHMPPKGDSLTDAEVKLLKTWIEEGADFGGWIGSKDGMPANVGGSVPGVMRKREHEEFYKSLEAGAKAVPDAVLKAAKAAGAQIAPISTTSTLVRVDFLTGVSSCTDEKVAALLPLADNIAHLDLGRTAITDAALATIAKMPRLARLDLRQTKITDGGLEALSGLKNLNSINVYGTAIGDAGLKNLANIKSLKNVYAFLTKITPAAASGTKGLNVVIK
ncbi:MAG: hypothetical protein JNJ83_05550 [Verrucomicrobiaceae bacterium]|nr:hypothetical protein [Verrucomicrobiaceae bacterium]